MTFRTLVRILLMLSLGMQVEAMQGPRSGKHKSSESATSSRGPAVKGSIKRSVTSVAVPARPKIHANAAEVQKMNNDREEHKKSDGVVARFKEALEKGSITQITLVELKEELANLYTTTALSDGEKATYKILLELLHVLVTDQGMQSALERDPSFLNHLKVSIIELLEKITLKSLFLNYPTPGALFSPEDEPEAFISRLIDLCKPFFVAYANMLVGSVDYELNAFTRQEGQLIIEHSAAYKKLLELRVTLGTKIMEREALQKKALQGQATKKKAGKGFGKHGPQIKKMSGDEAQLAEEIEAQKATVAQWRAAVSQVGLDRLYDALYRFGQSSLLIRHNRGCQALGEKLGCLSKEIAVAIFMLEEESEFKAIACKALAQFTQVELHDHLVEALQDYCALAHNPETADTVKGMRWEIAAAEFFHSKGMLESWGVSMTKEGGTLTREIDLMLKNKCMVECKNVQWESFICDDRIPGCKRAECFRKIRLAKFHQQLIHQKQIARSKGCTVMLLSRNMVPFGSPVMRLLSDERIATVDYTNCQAFDCKELYCDAPYKWVG